MRVTVAGVLMAGLVAAAQSTAFGAGALSCWERSADPDETIAGCTALLDHALQQPQDRMAQMFQAKLYFNRATAYADKGQFDLAVSDYDRVIALQPSNYMAYNNRGNVYGRQGDFEGAIRDFDKAIALRPDGALAYANRGMAYSRQGLHDRAITEFEKAIELDPNSGNANASLAWILATSPDRELRNGKRALRLARHAIEIHHYPRYFEALAAAHAENGNFEEAVRQQSRAIARFRELNGSGDIAALQSRLDLYRDGQPYRAE